MKLSNNTYESEKNNEFDEALIHALENEVKECASVKNVVHLLFVYWFLILEYNQDNLKDKLKHYYNNYASLFLSNDIFLFYVGWMLAIAPWYFGESNPYKGSEFLLKAYKLKGDNMLYKWACSDELKLSSEERKKIGNIVDEAQFDNLGYLIPSYFLGMTKSR